jgi:hypothetical protein
MLPVTHSGHEYRFWLVAALAVLAVAIGIVALTPSSSGDNASSGAVAPSSAPDIERAIPSMYYTLTLTVHQGLVPAPERRRAGGSLAAFGDGFVVVTAAGDFYRLSWEAGATRLRSDRLHVVAPFNRSALLEAVGAAAAAPFRITDLVVDERGSEARLYVAHHHWDRQANCVTLRVSSTAWPGTTPDPPGPWTTVFDSQPCLPVGRMWPLGEEADRSGGRLALHDLGLLLTVGDHGFDGLEGVNAFPQAADASYGKILLVDAAGGAVPFSIGHRNPQGLTVDADGRVWSSEHGPRGGDELNLIVRGENYGWPLVSDGSDYNNDVWPSPLNPADPGRFREPAFVFVTSTAPSELLQVRSTYWRRWSGDLLVGSLQAGKLFRIRTSGDGVVETEPIDLSNAHQGSGGGQGRAYPDLERRRADCIARACSRLASADATCCRIPSLPLPSCLEAIARGRSSQGR